MKVSQVLPAALLARLPRVPTLFHATAPALAAEVTDEHLALVRLHRGTGEPEVNGFFVARMPAQVVRPQAVHPNVLAPADLTSLIKAARDRVAGGGGPLALVLPDVVARIALIATESLPRRREQLRDLVAWRMKKTLPFRIEEAQVDTQVFPMGDGRHLVVAIVLRRRILAEYEAPFLAQGFQLGSVTISTFALADLVPPSAAGDTMLVNVGSGWFSILIANAGQPLFYRCKALPESERRGAERDWFVSGEMFPTLEYYRTRLGGSGIARVLLHVAGPGWQALADTLSTSVEVPIERVGGLASAGLPLEAAERMGSAVALALRGARREGASPQARGRGGRAAS